MNENLTVVDWKKVLFSTSSKMDESGAEVATKEKPKLVFMGGKYSREDTIF